MGADDVKERDGDEQHGVTVGRLRARLNEFDDSMLVVLAKDGEGNSFSPLAEVDGSTYAADSTWSGWLTEGEGVPCAVLWPTN